MAVKSTCFLFAVFRLGVSTVSVSEVVLVFGVAEGQDLAGGLSPRIAASNSVGPR